MHELLLPAWQTAREVSSREALISWRHFMAIHSSAPPCSVGTDPAAVELDTVGLDIPPMDVETDVCRCMCPPVSDHGALTKNSGGA